jgi:hypothetical protein
VTVNRLLKRLDGNQCKQQEKREAQLQLVAVDAAVHAGEIKLEIAQAIDAGGAVLDLQFGQWAEVGVCGRAVANGPMNAYPLVTWKMIWPPPQNTV